MAKSTKTIKHDPPKPLRLLLLLALPALVVVLDMEVFIATPKLVWMMLRICMGNGFRL